MLPLAFAWVSAAAFAASLLYFLYAYLFVFGVVHETGATLRPVVVNVGLFAVFALHHTVFARTGVKQRLARIVWPPLERALYTLVASILFALVCWLWQPVPGVLYALESGWRVLPYTSLALGLALTGAAARAIDPLDLAGLRQVQHESARRQDRAPALVTRGAYGFVRHPVYLGWILLVFGVPTMTMTRLTFALTSIAYLAVAIPFEERSLRETFGPDYASYQRKVRWRMLPGLY